MRPGKTTGSEVKALSFDIELNLAGVEAGEYICQVTALDPATDKSAFWRKLIRIVQ